MTAVLFARRDSIYKTIHGCDVWDIDRDARNYSGPFPVVAHPPCRAWGNFAMFAKPRDGEKDLAFFAVAAVRLWGGVLEHPFGSKLWAAAGLPEPGCFDQFGGFTVALPQFWFGHEAEKKTRLYICGCCPDDLPLVPLVLGSAPKVIGDVRTGGIYRKEISKADREKTPPAFAHWLLNVASLCLGGG
jgi:hypothetical protein